MDTLKWSTGAKMVDSMYYVREAGEEGPPPIEGAPLFGIVHVQDLQSEGQTEHYYWDGDKYQLVQDGDLHPLLSSQMRFCADHTAYGRCGWITREAFEGTLKESTEARSLDRSDSDNDVLDYGPPYQARPALVLADNTRGSSPSSLSSHGAIHSREEDQASPGTSSHAQKVDPGTLGHAKLLSESHGTTDVHGFFSMPGGYETPFEEHRLSHRSRGREPLQSPTVKGGTGQFRLAFKKLNQIIETRELTASDRRDVQIDEFSGYLESTYRGRRPRSPRQLSNIERKNTVASQEKISRDYYEIADEALEKAIEDLSRPVKLKKSQQLEDERIRRVERVSAVEKQMDDWRAQVQRLRREMSTARTRIAFDGEEISQDADHVHSGSDTEMKSFQSHSEIEESPERDLTNIEARLSIAEQRIAQRQSEAAARRLDDEERKEHTLKLMVEHSAAFQKSHGDVVTLRDRVRNLQVQHDKLNQFVRDIRDPNYSAAIQLIESRLRDEMTASLNHETEGFQSEHRTRVDANLTQIQKPFTFIPFCLPSLSSDSPSSAN